MLELLYWYQIERESKVLVANNNSIMEGISKFMAEDKDKDEKLRSSIRGAAVYDDKNCVVVYLKNEDEDIIKLFKSKISNSDAVVFEKEKEVPVNQSYIYPGQAVAVPPTLGYSVGFRAKRKLSDGTYEYGFVTAAHGFFTGTNFKIGTTVIGTVTAQKYSGDADVSFVKITNSDYTMSNAIYGSTVNVDPGVYYYPVVGSTVYKSGYKTYVTGGTVKSVNASFTDENGVYQTNMSTASYSSFLFITIESVAK